MYTAASYGGNQLALRVLERRSNKLDQETVDKMKTWLIMVGFDHGLTIQEVCPLQTNRIKAYAESTIHHKCMV